MQSFLKKSKGYIIGALFGSLLTIGFTANAAVTDMIGKVIDGQFPLFVNGAQTEKPAIVIEGTSYIPVRAAGEQFGYDISFIDSTIIMKPLEGVVNLDAVQKHRAERQAAYDKLKAEQAAIKTPEQLKQEEVEANSKAAQEALEAHKKEMQDKYDADLKAEADRLKAQESAQQQASPTPTPVN